MRNIFGLMAVAGLSAFAAPAMADTIINAPFAAYGHASPTPTSPQVNEGTRGLGGDVFIDFEGSRYEQSVRLTPNPTLFASVNGVESSSNALKLSSAVIDYAFTITAPDRASADLFFQSRPTVYLDGAYTLFASEFGEARALLFTNYNSESFLDFRGCTADLALADCGSGFFHTPVDYTRISDTVFVGGAEIQAQATNRYFDSTTGIFKDAFSASAFVDPVVAIDASFVSTGFSIVNVVSETITIPGSTTVSGTPEPATWLSMLVGFAIVGVSARRGNRRARAMKIG